MNMKIINKEINEPRLRFPGFEDEWEEKKLKDIVDFSKGKGYSLSDTIRFNRGNDNFCYPIVLYGDLFRDYSSSILEIKRYSNKLLKNAKISEGNEVLIPSSSTADRMSIANPRALLKDGVIIGSDIIILRVKNSRSCDNVFLQHYLMEKSMSDFHKVIEGITVKHIYENSFSIFKVFLPSLSEQEKIRSFFKTFDSLVKNQEEYIERMKERKKGLLQDVFSKKIRMKDENGKEFKGEWEEVKLGDFRQSFKLEKNDLNDYLEIGDICVETKSYVVSSKKAPKGAKCVPKNTLLISKVRPTRGAFTITMDALLCSSALYDIYNDCEYIIYFLKASITNSWFNYRMSVLSTGTTYPSVKNKDISNHKIFAPSLPEQKAIGRFFKTIDKKIEKEEELLNKYKMLKKALLQDMFI